MSDMLSQIVDHKRQEIAQARQLRPLEEVKAAALDSPTPRNFFAAVTQPARHLHVIAEVKKASPSAGVIREDFDPVRIAEIYADNGASALSCLTDEHYFQGSLDYIAQIKQAVDLPVMRKDFIVDAYQVYEARAAGADAVLLIAECLTEPGLLDLLILATELKLTTLVEVHDLESLVQVQHHIGFPHPSYTLLGVNNRNLKTMTTDIEHTLNMLPHIHSRDNLVSESGIRSHEDIERLTQAGVYRVLVGEHLMREQNIGAALRTLMGR